MFPINPGQAEIDDRGLFIVQNPGLRACILPLFSFDPRAAEERPIGHGTVFRIDPWSRCATAFHVVEDIFEIGSKASPPPLVLKPGIRLAALELSGIFYGRRGLPPNAWRPLSESFSIFGIEQQPFAEPKIRNACELMTLRIRPSTGPENIPYLPLRLRGWHPKIGEMVQALGFADLDRCPDGGTETRPLVQNLYGAMGRIIDIEQADGSRGRPWPQIRVEANWPGGMSGGPVFNEAGAVIGLVSSGIEGAGIGSATFFSGWSLPEVVFRSLDPDNPGSFLCHAAFGDGERPMVCSQDEAEMQRMAADHGLTDFGFVSVNPLTGAWMRLNPPQAPAPL
jgi:serine protease Do